MKKLLVILVALAMLTGCSAGMFNGGAKIAVKNQETQRISLTDALGEIDTQYGEPVPHYRAFKNANGEAHIISDIIYRAGKHFRKLRPAVLRIDFSVGGLIQFR